MDIEFSIYGSTTLGEILRVARQRKELKVYELAKLVKVNPVYITQIEKNYKLPSIETFLKIMELLDVDLPTFHEIEDRFILQKFPDFNKTRNLFVEFYIKHYPNPKKILDKITKEKLRKIKKQ